MVTSNANFLLTDPVVDEASHLAKLKLTDFNLAAVYKPGEIMTQSCGSLNFVAPEVLEESYTNLCDMWSYGMSLYMLVTGRPYWPDSISDHECMELIVNGTIQLHDPRFQKQKELKDFMHPLFLREKAGRISAKKARQNAWLNGHPFADGIAKGCCVLS